MARKDVVSQFCLDTFLPRGAKTRAAKMPLVSLFSGLEPDKRRQQRPFLKVE